MTITLPERAHRPPAGLSPAQRVLAAETLIAAAIFLGLALWTLGAGLRDWDEGVYWQSLRALTRGEPLFSSVFASQPSGFYYALLPFYLAGHSIESLRIAVLLLTSAGLVAIYFAGRFLAGHEVGLVSVLLLATSPLFIHQSTVAQADAPAVGLAVVAVALALAAGQAGGRKRWALAAAAGLTLALATGIKLFGALAIVPILIALVSARPRRLSTWAAFAGGLLVGFALIALPIAVAPATALRELFFHGAGSQSFHFSTANLGLLLLTRELPLEALAVAGALVAAIRRDSRILAPLAWAIVSVAAILVYQPLFPHHLVLLPPSLALTAGVGFASLRQSAPLTTAAITAILLAAVAGIEVGARDAWQVAKPDIRDQTLAAAVRAESRPGDFVITDNLFAVALADRDVPSPLVDTSHQRTDAGLLTVNDLDAAANRYGVKLVLVDGNRLTSIPGFSDWLVAHYHALREVEPGATLYSRTAS